MAPAQPPRCAWSRKRHCRWLPRSRATRARTRHSTASAPWRDQRRRRRDSQATCSRTRARWRLSYDPVFVSIATAIPLGEIATESMSPRPCHRSECRSRQPSARSGASAVWTASSEQARPDSGERARASGARTGRAQRQRRGGTRRREPHSRGRPTGQAARCRRPRSRRRRRATAGGTAGVAHRSRCDHLDHPTGARRSWQRAISGRATTLRLPFLVELVREWTRLPAVFGICWRFVYTATGIRTRVSAVRGRRPSPLDDSGGTWRVRPRGRDGSSA